MTISKLAPVIAILGLAACGGGSGGNDGAEGDAGLKEYSFDELLTRSEALEAKIFSGENDFTAFADLPAGGVVAYDGFMVVGIVQGANEGEGVIGTLELTADFDDNRITGRAGAFVNDRNQERAGSLTITDGQIRADEFDTAVFQADASGSISFESGRTNVSGVIEADFVGSNGELIDGAMLGTATLGGTSQVVGGAFVAERR